MESDSGWYSYLNFVYGAKVITITRSEQKKAIELDAILLLIQQTHSKVVNMGQKIIPDGAHVIYECVGRRETIDACWMGRGSWCFAADSLIGYTTDDKHNFVCHLMPLIVYEQSVIGTVGATLADLKKAAYGAVKTINGFPSTLERTIKGI
jgi:D-arabinose 1-dehydrogenase-like Zn-dependent alcohol dehydrogenase